MGMIKSFIYGTKEFFHDIAEEMYDMHKDAFFRSGDWLGKLLVGLIDVLILGSTLMIGGLIYNRVKNPTYNYQDSDHGSITSVEVTPTKNLVLLR